MLFSRHTCLRHAQLALTVAIRPGSLRIALFLVDILWVFRQGAPEDLLYLANLADTLLFIIAFLVMTLDHVYQLVDVAAGDDDVAHFFLGLHLFLHQKLICQLLGHDSRVEGYIWIFLDGDSECFSELEQLFVFRDLMEALL